MSNFDLNFFKKVNNFGLQQSQKNILKGPTNAVLCL